MRSQPHNVKTIKSDNRALIFSHVRRGPTSRAEISKKSGMSKSAVTMITGELINEGQLVEIGMGESAHGRKSILLDIVANYRYAAGIALHRKYVYVCITDLKSNILAYSNHRTDKWSNPYELLDFSCSEIMRFLDELNIPREKCIGIGVSAPGPLDYVSGKILNPPEFPMFHGIGVGDYLRKRTGLPVMVDNNSALLCMQHFTFSGEDRKNCLFAVISDGIGSAVMTRGQILRGALGFAGELGHTSIHADGIPCSCGNRGCLEKYISLKALQERFGFASYEKMVDDAYMGDRESCEILEYIADKFACALTNAINLLDLDSVVIYGQLSYRSEKLLAMLHERINRCSVITRTHGVDITFSQLPPDAASASVCSMVINRYFEQKL